MGRRRTKQSGSGPVGEYKHEKFKRKNTPPAGLVKGEKDVESYKSYYPEIDPHDSPFLMFKNRHESDQINVQTVSLHTHESIHPPTIVEPILKGRQHVLDDFFEITRPRNEAVEFYKHNDDWTNRLIAGDNLLVMNSLLEKENKAGQVKMIYFDPPYGIKFNSNFQPKVFDTSVRDRVDSIEERPESIKAFRDTWMLGVHSYLSATRKRLELARRLLSDTGSIFVQISNTNQHFMRVLLDEIFGPENLVWQILFRTKGGAGVGAWPHAYDYILWYAKDKKQAIESGHLHQLWEDRTDESIKKTFGGMELKDGTVKSHGGKVLPPGARYCKIMPLHSQGESTTDRSKPHTFPNNETVSIPSGRQWIVGHDELDVLYHKKRIRFTEKRADWIYYPEDAPRIITNVWEGMQINQKNYVIETKDKVLERCIQLTTDVGDLVLDITGGSGVTAYAAEKWGRRWITCDVSRVSIATIKWRLQTASFLWYKLTNDVEGVDSGFEYETFFKRSAKTLSNTEDLDESIRYDKPKIVKERSRVTGPFTIDAIPAPTISNDTVKTSVRSDWLTKLADSGIVTNTGQRLVFDRVERNTDVKSPIHASAFTGKKKTAISFGSEHGPMSVYQVESVLNDVSTDAIFIAFVFDPHAQSLIGNTENAFAVSMNNDILIEDLKSKSTDQPFSIIGEPDIKIRHNNDKFTVELLGYNYYDPHKGKNIVGNTQNVAMWMLDTDYDGRTLRVKQFFFPNKQDAWKDLEKTLRSSVNTELLEKYLGTESIPFESGNYKKIAIKVIDMDGNESMKVEGLEEW